MAPFSVPRRLENIDLRVNYLEDERVVIWGKGEFKIERNRREYVNYLWGTFVSILVGRRKRIIL